MKKRLWKRVLAGVLSAVLVLNVSALTGAQPSSSSSTWDQALENFQNPPDYMKSRPLWFWNTEVSDMTVFFRNGSAAICRRNIWSCTAQLWKKPKNWA